MPSCRFTSRPMSSSCRFGRVGAVIAMDVEDYRLTNHQRTFLLHEKGGKVHHVPTHHRLVEYLREYMDATGLWDRPKEPLFQALDRTKSRCQWQLNIGPVGRSSPKVGISHASDPNPHRSSVSAL